MPFLTNLHHPCDFPSFFQAMVISVSSMDLYQPSGAISPESNWPSRITQPATVSPNFNPERSQMALPMPWSVPSWSFYPKHIIPSSSNPSSIGKSCYVSSLTAGNKTPSYNIYFKLNAPSYFHLAMASSDGVISAVPRGSVKNISCIYSWN